MVPPISLGMSSILLLEDDPILGQTVTRGLELEGYKVMWAQDLRGALQIRKRAPVDLYILDWNLPDGVGLTVCEKVREKDHAVPILFLTARTEEEAAVQALTSGAQDFVRKPCGQAELLARVKRLLGEALSQGEILRFGNLVLETDCRKARFKDVAIEVSGKEFDVLVHLVRNGGVISSREAILDIIDPERMISDRAVDSHMSRLRNRFRKLGIEAIEIRCIYGEGYRLEKAG